MVSLPHHNQRRTQSICLYIFSVAKPLWTKDPLKLHNVRNGEDNPGTRVSRILVRRDVNPLVSCGDFKNQVDSITYIVVKATRLIADVKEQLHCHYSNT